MSDSIDANDPRSIPVDTIKAAVASWLDDNWRIDRPLAEWREILVDAGWGAPDWPAWSPVR